MWSRVDKLHVYVMMSVCWASPLYAYLGGGRGGVWEKILPHTSYMRSPSSTPIPIVPHNLDTPHTAFNPIVYSNTSECSQIHVGGNTDILKWIVTVSQDYQECISGECTDMSQLAFLDNLLSVHLLLHNSMSGRFENLQTTKVNHYTTDVCIYMHRYTSGFNLW